jgi:hypothetical protein
MFGKTSILLYGQGDDISKASTVEMSGRRVVYRMRLAPVGVGCEGDNAKKEAERVIRRARGKERPMSAIMLDDEESYKTTGRWDR